MRGAAVYGYAKERAGPLRPGVLTVEETVKSVMGPVYDKFHLVPEELLRHADHKVDAAEHRAPAASDRAKSVYSKYEGVAKELCERYEPKAEQCKVSVWRRLNRVADVALPKAAYWTEKYNETVVAAAERGYRVCAYLPLVPMPTKKAADDFVVFAFPQGM